MPSKKKVTTPKTPKAPKPTVEKQEKPLDYFRPGTTVGVIAAYVADERTHQIVDVIENAKKVAKVNAKQADFAFRVLFQNKYPDGKIGKIASKGLGHATVDLATGTVQFHRGAGNTKVIRADEREKPLKQPIMKPPVKKSAGAVKPPETAQMVN